MNCKYLFFSIILILSLPLATAFEDNFQYYPGGDISSNWITSTTGSGTYVANADTITQGATYSRVMRVEADSGVGGSASSSAISRYGTTSNYWSFNLRDKTNFGSSTTVIRFYDSSGNSVSSLNIISSTYGIGLWEITISGTDVFLRINGIDKGIIGTTTGQPYFIGFALTGSNNNGNRIYVDDISTTGYISGIGTESTSHTLTESNLNPTNISYTINTFPFATYTTDYISNSVQKYNGSSTPISIISTTIKTPGNSTVFSGFTNYNRKTQITSNDTNYGLYFSYTQKNNITQSSDYFFLVPPGATNSITMPDSTIIIGQVEPITYSIGAPDFTTYTYSVNVYSLTQQITTFAIPSGVPTGTFSWVTSSLSPGIYFAVLSRISSAGQTDIAYTTATLSPNLLITGKTYDAQNATPISNVYINFSQNNIWYNTTSDSNGNYNLSGLIVNVLTNANASKFGYTHTNFSFTPLAPQIYTMDLYLFNNSIVCSEVDCIAGLTLSYPYHQAVSVANVLLSNGTYSNTTSSLLTTGFYNFSGLANGSYTVNASKSGYLNSSTYSVVANYTTVNTQIILMNATYTINIVAQDSSTGSTILTFQALFNGILYNTTTGTISISNVLYGLYPTTVQSTGFISSTQNILVDTSKTATFTLSEIPPIQTSTIFKTLPHDVSFTVQDLSFNKYPGVLVTAQGFNTTTGSFSFLCNLIGLCGSEAPLLNQSMNGTTGTDGSIDFKMDGSIYYIITFNGTGFSNITWKGYPTQYNYIIMVPINFLGTFNNNTNEFATISTTISTRQNSSNSMDIKANYSDSLSQTSSIIVYLNRSIASDPNNQTNIQTINGGTNSSFNATFTVSPFAGNSYIVTFVFTENSIGTVTRSYGVTFPQTSPVSFFNPVSVLMLIVALVLFIASFFGQTSTEQGSGIIVGLVWLLSGMGLYQGLNLGAGFYLGLTLATIIAILMNINARSRKEGMS